MRSYYFLKNTRGVAYLNFVLIFDSNIQNYFTWLCAFKLRETKRILYCGGKLQVSEAVLGKISVSPVAWVVANELNVPKRLDSNLSELWKIYYFKKCLDKSFLIDSLKRTNESITKSGSISLVSGRQQCTGPSVSGHNILLAN
jgi:hypothetical protein